jgi:glycosyltransferase involved in cell wall biosynthesis
MKYLLVIQPLIASYRKDFFDTLSHYFDKVVIYANLETTNGFKSDIDGKFEKVHTPVLGKREKIYYQKGIIKSILKEKPTAIYLTADFRALHYFLILMVAKVLNIPIFPHGQGLYDKPNPGFVHKVLFKATIALSSSYICYTKSVYDSLVDIGIHPNKLSIMDNTIVNHYTIRIEDKKDIKNKLIYIGRLREGSNLALLFDAMKLLKDENIELSLDIVGDGNERENLEKYAKELNLNIHFLGAIYDDKKISEVSKEAKVGVYPGDAGLSIVHYMSLSLIPIVHSSLERHMGPEPSYIKDGYNGFLFDRNNAISLAKNIKKALFSENIDVASNAFATYMKLSNPSMGEKFINIIQAFIGDKK